MLERLRVRNFRGLSDVAIEEPGRINLVAGRNNAGKTTLIEMLFLLAGAGNPQRALNRNLTRIVDQDAMPASIGEALWTPLFFELDTDRDIEISGRHAALGDLSLAISLEKPVRTEVHRKQGNGALTAEHAREARLTFKYADEHTTRTGRAHETAENVTFDWEGGSPTIGSAILEPGSENVKQDAIMLGRLRRQKSGDLILEALRVIEPGLRGIEDNSSGGTPMIWVDVGLRELVPLPVMGAGMTPVARIVLAAATVPGGVVLVDEIENGLHHSVLPDVWRVVERMAEAFDVQVFATTHSFECVEAAHKALGGNGFRLHRLEIVDGGSHCVTYSEDALDGAIRHHMEVR